MSEESEHEGQLISSNCEGSQYRPASVLDQRKHGQRAKADAETKKSKLFANMFIGQTVSKNKAKQT